MSPPVSALTRDGYDYQFGVNVLGKCKIDENRNLSLTKVCKGHFYFTQLLLPVLKEGARTSNDHVARVINISSQAHVLSSINFDKLTDTPARTKTSPADLYGQSKFVRPYIFLPQTWFINTIIGSCGVF